MSNDSTRPQPDPEKITGMTPKQANEATEIDLWDLDSDDSEFASPDASVPSSSGGLPSRSVSGNPSIQSKKPAERQIESPPVKEDQPAPKPKRSRAKAKSSPPPEAEAEAAVEISREEPEDDFPDGEESVESSSDSKDAKPLSPGALIASLSKIEKIAVSGLVAVLALGAALTCVHLTNRVPTRPLVSEEIDFPVSGKIVEITEAVTYWREPVITGGNADVVRRGTRLIPVVKMNLISKSGAIRVFFRDDQGLVIGDGITRTLKGDGEIIIGATAGFEDVGMHTAYRTGDSEPWVVQVFEAPDATAPREKFRKVLEMEISTLVR